MLDTEFFFSQVESLKSPLSGSELMAPLLYALIRSIRPRSVVEVGMGAYDAFHLAGIDRESSRFSARKKGFAS